MRRIFLILLVASLGLWGGLSRKASQMLAQARELIYREHLSDKPGLLLETKNGSAEIAALDVSHLTQPLFSAGTFTAQIRGFLVVPKTGNYTLELASDDSAVLHLDGNPAIENRGLHAYSAKKKTLRLSRGPHALHLAYANHGGPAAVKLLWGEKGKTRQTVGGAQTRMPRGDPLPVFERRDLPPNEDLVSGALAEKWVRLNRWRAASLSAAAAALFLLLFGKRMNPYLRRWETWGALGVFALAFALRWFYFSQHLHQRIHLITDGGDNHYYMMLPLRFVTHGDFTAFNCGNLAILLPLVGLIYKYFCFFPGLNYFAFLGMALGAAAALMPWWLLRRDAPAAGLLAGLFLAVHPSLIELKISFVSSDPLGFFFFCLAMVFCVQALRGGTLRAHLLAGAGLAAMALSRTVFIPLSPLLAAALALFSPNRRRALAGCAVFAGICLAYELLAYPVLKESYFLHFIREGFDATKVYRLPQMPEPFWEKLLWLPSHLFSFASLIFNNLLPLEIPGAAPRWIALAAFVAAAALLLRRLPRVFFFFTVLAAAYLYEISSYHLQERLTFPLVFVAGLILALGLATLPRLGASRATAVTFALLFSLGWVKAAGDGFAAVKQRRGENEFLRWVKREAPPESVLLAGLERDPWLTHGRTGLPVFYEPTDSHCLVVPSTVIAVRRVSFLYQQAAEDADTHLDAQPRIFSNAAGTGRRWLALDRRHAEQLENFGSAGGAKIRLIKTYPGNPEKGLWEWVWPAENAKGKEHA